MKYCPNCRLSYDDSANVCGHCGNPLTYIPPQTLSDYDHTDHTAEFSPEDISQNKVIAMLPYLFSWLGIIIALIASGASPYTAFHVKQALKIQIVATLVSIVGAFIPIIGWIAIGIYSLVSLAINIVCFFRVCKGEAKEPPIIKNLRFLK